MLRAGTVRVRVKVIRPPSTSPRELPREPVEIAAAPAAVPATPVTETPIADAESPVTVSPITPAPTTTTTSDAAPSVTAPVVTTSPVTTAPVTRTPVPRRLLSRQLQSPCGSGQPTAPCGCNFDPVAASLQLRRASRSLLRPRSCRILARRPRGPIRRSPRRSLERTHASTVARDRRPRDDPRTGCRTCRPCPP